MRNNTSIIYNICLLIGDGIALIGGLSVAYILRVSISHVPVTASVSSSTYLKFLLILAPFWLFTFAILGLYTERYYEKRFNELARLGIGTFIGIMFAISYSYMINQPIFPARLVVVYGFIFSLIAVFIYRTIARAVQRKLFSYGIGLNNVLIVGNTKMTKNIIESLPTNVTGYKIIGIVGYNKNISGKELEIKTFSSFSEAVSKIHNKQIHTIIQTELYPAAKDNDEILNYAQSNHIAYRFVPGNSELFVGNIKVDLLQSMPIIAVHQTALIGWGKVVKRLTDLIVGLVLVLISLPFAVLIILAEKVTCPKGQIFFRANRYSRYGQVVEIYKFRTFKPEYTNMSPQEAFNKMGRPEIIKEYVIKDRIDNDPRVSKLGAFLRKTSLDEIPQLFSIVKGDISLVGPRALDTFELEKYSKKNLILAVKSGLTGLAQISGRRNLSYEEKRRIDLYYVQNWTFWGDIIILIKTVWVVLFHQGAA